MEGLRGVREEEKGGLYLSGVQRVGSECTKPRTKKRD